MNLFIMVQSLSLCLTGYGWWGQGSFKNLIDPLPDIAILRHRNEMTRVVLLPLLPTFSTLFGASDADIGGCDLATASGRARFNQSEGGPDNLLTRDVLS
jgi:hypothetical protein